MPKSGRGRNKRTPDYNDWVRCVEAHIAKGEQRTVPELAAELNIGMLQAYAWSARYAKAHEQRSA